MHESIANNFSLYISMSWLCIKTMIDDDYCVPHGLENLYFANFLFVNTRGFFKVFVLSLLVFLDKLSLCTCLAVYDRSSPFQKRTGPVKNLFLL